MAGCRFARYAFISRKFVVEKIPFPCPRVPAQTKHAFPRRFFTGTRFCEFVLKITFFRRFFQVAASIATCRAERENSPSICHL